MNEILRRILFLPEQASTVAADIDGLHYLVIITTILGATGVGLLAAVLLFRYRRRSHHVPLTPYVHVPLWLEVVFVTGTLSLFVFFWWIGFAQFKRLALPPRDAMEVYVTAKKWMWKFSYPQGPSSIAVLTVPAGRPVKLIMTSRDVIHSFFVPEFRVKQDVVPGRYTTVWFEARRAGIYDIFCTEYCGTGHSTMRGQVVVLSAEDYGRWLTAAGAQAGQAPPAGGAPATALAEQGRVIAAEQGCLGCHSVDGHRHIGPTWGGLYLRRTTMTDGEVVVADEAYLTESMMDPLRRHVEGFDPIMPSYQGRLSPAETAALLEYIKALRDVQPVATPTDAPPGAPAHGHGHGQGAP